MAPLAPLNPPLVVAVGVLVLLVLLPVIVRCALRSVTLPACSAGSVPHAAPETQAEMMAAGWAAGPADMAAVGAQGHSPRVLPPSFCLWSISNCFC